MKVILDTNIWVSFLLGKRLSILCDIVEMEGLDIYVSEELIQEIRDVVFRPKFSGKISFEAILNLFELINAKCYFLDSHKDIASTIRDVKDLYLLSMAESIPADYLVTGDNDFLVLKNHKETRIVTFQEFVGIVKELS
ncbi:MAG: putative toxin-antitoxin system toxin component, PIN family [Bacteroidales bacterium]|nr:putative toxin-antitoxin system toxin component, PIN family [Bacteroidales bacterium]